MLSFCCHDVVSTNPAASCALTSASIAPQHVVGRRLALEQLPIGGGDPQTDVIVASGDFPRLSIQMHKTSARQRMLTWWRNGGSALFPFKRQHANAGVDLAIPFTIDAFFCERALDLCGNLAGPSSLPSRAPNVSHKPSPATPRSRSW